MTRTTRARMIGLVGWGALVTGAAAQEHGAIASATSPAKAEEVTIRVVDDLGKPAPGITVGNVLYRSIEQGAEPRLVFAGGEESPTIATDADGAARVAAKFLFPQRARPMPIIALDREGERIGLAKVEDKDLGGTVEVRLHRACRVTAKLSSTGLEKLGRTLSWANVYVYWDELRPMSCAASDGVHEFWLPPGEYRLSGYGRDTDTQRSTVTVAPGQESLVIRMDLPPSRLAELMGRPAPELSQIKGWKNGGPVTLRALKGKVVLLDFWGCWCGPCVHAMPELMEMHEKYAERGLVIVAVHDDSVADIAEMDLKLEGTRRDLWKGRDLPFLVALDGGGEVTVEGHEGTARGATTGTYGIRAFPTTVLIDRAGNVVGQLSKGNRGVEQLEKALGESPPAK